jgi:hypothetical protein
LCSRGDNPDISTKVQLDDQTKPDVAVEVGDDAPAETEMETDEGHKVTEQILDEKLGEANESASSEAAAIVESAIEKRKFADMSGDEIEEVDDAEEIDDVEEVEDDEEVDEVSLLYNFFSPLPRQA